MSTSPNFLRPAYPLPEYSHVHLETVEAAKDEGTKPYQTWDTKILCTYGGKQQKRLLENIQHYYGQKSIIKRKTDKQRLL